MIEIKLAAIEDLEIIHQLASDIWWPTYKNVISDEQIAFMLNKMYSISALQNQMHEENVFLLLYVNELAKGFASYSKTAIDKTYKLQKLYLHPDQQGKGTGKLLIVEVEKQVKTLGGDALILNVNRGNKAKDFYKKVGYQILQELDIPYFHFVLNDYVMGKKLI
ncbi:GNAT family N-acetyltransferase [Pedobacter cryophilus]|uniref:GNAT family N-acetyltransferase n=1 Tax=Pedobacter cryophilus TaxID=2571271 RepID=A0A4U1C492_9SPHI|nr:GNAT family N-acetyltransferase [Pedobacter cryophilus]TKC00660.1 GNAT family N-acetyltransferase [Pedobacter cryophilus]